MRAAGTVVGALGAATLLVSSRSVVRRSVVCGAACVLLLGGCIGLLDFGDRDHATAPGDAGIVTGDGGAQADAPDATAPDSSAPEGTVIISGGPVTVVWDDATSTTRLTHDYYVDVHEVTVGQFRAWIEAGLPAPCPGQTCSLDPGGYGAAMSWYPPDDAYVASQQYLKAGFTVTGGSPVLCEPSTGISNDPKDIATYPIANDLLPVNCVTFAQAASVCHFRGMRLLTEVEWYWAASGRGVQRRYPWGNDMPAICTDAIFGLPGSNNCEFPTPVMTAARDVSRDGVHDFAGSLAEWVYGGEIPSQKPATLPDDYTGPPRVTDTANNIRGGSFASSAADAQTISRKRRGSLRASSTSLGFRCAKTKL